MVGWGNTTFSVYLSDSLQDSGVQISIDGQSAEVWKTNNPAVGVAYELQFDHGISSYVFSDKNRHKILANVGNRVDFGAKLATRLVKIGPPGGGDITLPFDVAYVDTTAEGDGIVNFGYGGDITVTLPTCQIQTQNVNVPMGDVSMLTFKGVGSMSQPKEFVVKMTCSAGFNKLSYQLAPAGGSSALDAKKGLLSLSNSGGASGVGVQLQDWYGTPLALQEARPISDYDPQNGGEYQITNKAVYIQTEDHVKGGEADAQAVFTLSYQ